jgi:D-tyrosyl-tRNA(Tyr) deacylase
MRYNTLIHGFLQEGSIMRAVVSRVSSASVTVGERCVGEIGKGFLVLLGIHREDTAAQADKLADKLCGLRVFEDEAGKMNRNLADAGGALLIVSQFTLYADTRSRRPGFTEAARPETAVPLYEQVIARCRERGFSVETGEFGADMAVQSVGDGPVTILLEV